MTRIATSTGVRAAHVTVPFESDTPDPARLAFDNGVQNLRVSAGAAEGTLVEANYGEPLPHTWTAGGTVHVEYPLGSRFLRRVRDNSIALTPRTAWAIDVHGGMSELDADLTELDVRSFACYTGAAHSTLVLGRPTTASTLRFDSVSHLRIERPDDVPVRLELAKSATHLEFVTTSLGAVSGGFSHQTDGYASERPGYLVVLSGSATRLTIV